MPQKVPLGTLAILDFILKLLGDESRVGLFDGVLPIFLPPELCPNLENNY
jgi:predicted nucleotidyltransferase